VSGYQILCTATTFRELGPTYLDTRDKERVTANLVRRIEILGFHVNPQAVRRVTAGQRAFGAGC
jgi:hypothetical protein